MSSKTVNLGRLSHLKEIEQKVLHRPRPAIEKKTKEFAFSKYFIGHAPPEPALHKPNWKLWRNDQFTMAWLGHSTTLINFYGTWIMTDPVFSERVGIDILLRTVGPRRLVQPPLDPSELPKIDLILISHAHMDHTDPPSLKKLKDASHVLIAANTSLVYKHIGFQDLREIDWDQRIEYPDHDDLSVQAIEVRHAGWRMPWHPCRSRNEKNGFSYNAYLVEKHDPDGKLRSFVFGGDTGYLKSFRKLGDKMRMEGREIDLAIMPIGAYNPWVNAHCNPDQSWRMTCEMNARYIAPVHWNTYVQSSEPRYEPIEWLKSLVSSDEIVLTEHGQTWTRPLD